jgi:hypothetical protein
MATQSKKREYQQREPLDLVAAKEREHELAEKMEKKAVIEDIKKHFGNQKRFDVYKNEFYKSTADRVVFEEHGRDLQRHGPTVHKLVSKQTDLIKETLDEYSVFMGKAVQPTKLSVFTDEVLSSWNKFEEYNHRTNITTVNEYAGPPDVLAVMLLEYLERLQVQGTVFVSKERVVKPGTVMVLLMLGIVYNDDEAPLKKIFNLMIRSVKSISNMTLDEIGMSYIEPPFGRDGCPRDGDMYEEPIPRKKSYAEAFLDTDIKRMQSYFAAKAILEMKADATGKETVAEKATKLESDAMVMCVNAKLIQNLDKKLTLVALNALEMKMLKALDWQLGYVKKSGEIRSDGITPKEGEEESPHWNLAWHDADNKHWFWQRLSKINPQYAAVDGEKV